MSRGVPIPISHRLFPLHFYSRLVYRLVEAIGEPDAISIHRSSAGHTGPAHSSHPVAGAAPRLGCVGTYPADLQRRLACATGVALSRAAPPRAPRLDQSPMGDVREQSQSKVLRAHQSWTTRTRNRTGRLAEADGGREPDPRNCLGGRVLLHDLLFRLRILMRHPAAENELDDELHFHLERQTDKYVRSGMSEAEALRHARLEFGGLDKVKDDCREARGVSLVESLVQDLHYTARTLLRSPGFTACAVLTLALGIGANTAIFSVVNTVLLNPLPYSNPQELLAARQNEALPNLKDMQRQTASFASSGGINIEPVDFTGNGEPVRVHAANVDAGLLGTLGVQPMLGHWISTDEDVKGGPLNVVLSYAFWREFLGADPHVLGRAIRLRDKSYTVIGVMPRNFTLPRELADVFVSFAAGYP